MTAAAVHLPDAGSANPYQRNLVDALNQSGTPTTLVNPERPVLFAALRAAHASDADIIHLHWLHAFYYGDNLVETVIKSVMFVVELSLLRLFGYSVVWTAHNRIPHDASWPTYHQVYRRLFVTFSAAAVVVHCPRAKDVLAQSYGLDKRVMEKFHVVPHGNYIGDYANNISREQARESLSLGDETTFLFFGGLRPYKGVEDLLSAYKGLDDSHTHLIIAGSPSSERYGRQLEARVKNRDDVTLITEFIPDEDLQIYFNAADMGIFPFRDVLTSGSVISALSFGCPPIVPNIGCNEYLVGDNAGIVYEPEKPLENILADACDADIDAMRDDALTRAKSLDWLSIGKKTADIYAEVFES